MARPILSSMLGGFGPKVDSRFVEALAERSDRRGFVGLAHRDIAADLLRASRFSPPVTSA
jgi:hypothetical protein